MDGPSGKGREAPKGGAGQAAMIRGTKHLDLGRPPPTNNNHGCNRESSTPSNEA